MAVFGEEAGWGGFGAVRRDPLEGGTLKQNQMILLVLK